MKWSSTLDTIVFLSGATMKTTSQTVSLEVPTEQVWSPARCIRPAADGGRVPECQSDKRRLWVGSPPPVADYFPSGEKSRWNPNSSDGTQPTASPSCKESIGKHKQDEKKTFLRGAVILTLDDLKNSPDVVVIQPQHLQVFKQADTLRNLGQTVVVQQ